jgi:hypothetical protein
MSKDTKPILTRLDPDGRLEWVVDTREMICYISYTL